VLVLELVDVLLVELTVEELVLLEVLVDVDELVVVVELDVVVVVVAAPQLQPELFTILRVTQSVQNVIPPSTRQFLTLKITIDGQQGAPGQLAVTLHCLTLCTLK